MRSKMKRLMIPMLVAALLLSGCTGNRKTESSAGSSSAPQVSSENRDPSSQEEASSDPSSEAPASSEEENGNGDQTGDNGENPSSDENNEEEPDQPDESSRPSGTAMVDSDPLRGWAIPWRENPKAESMPDPKFPPSPNTEKGKNIPLDLTDYFNRRSITTDANPKEGMVGDTPGPYNYVLCAEGVSGSFDYNGVPFRLGPTESGKNNAICCEGQTIKLDSPMECDYIGIVVVKTEGDDHPGSDGYWLNFKVKYTDGTWNKTPVAFRKWHDTADGGKALALPHCHYYATDGSSLSYIPGPYYLRYSELDCDPGKKVEAIEFPSYYHMSVYALTLVNARR